MSALDLVAVMPVEVAARAPMKGPDGQPLLWISEGHLVAIASPEARTALFSSRKSSLKSAMIAFQRLLEQLQDLGPLVPAAFGTKFETSAAVRQFIAGNASALKQSIETFGHLREFRISIAWKPEEMLRHLKTSGDLAAVLGDAPVSNVSALAEALRDGMEQYRKSLSARFLAELQATTVDLIEMPLESGNALVNIVVLANPADESRLDAALERIDRVATEALSIKVAGPSPACAFASIGVEHLGIDRLVEARRQLGVPREFEQGDLDQAFRETVRRLHPDCGGTAGTFDIARQAQALLARVARMDALLDTPGSPEPNERLLLRFRRADDVSAAA